MANRLNKGDIAYIVDNGHFLREVKVLRVTRDLFTICYLDRLTCKSSNLL